MLQAKPTRGISSEAPPQQRAARSRSCGDALKANFNSLWFTNPGSSY